MAADYKLYYWPIPFRGQFIRTLLAYVGATWEEADFETIRDLKGLPVSDQPCPFMGPPVLSDAENDHYLSQLTAIMFYLGEKHGLMPADLEKRATALKICCDSNDVLDEITRFGGRQMWDEGAWEEFLSHRFVRWLEIFEQVAVRHGATPQAGTMLGTKDHSLADIVTSALWHTMMDSLPELAPVIQSNAPSVASIAMRVASTPAIASLNKAQRERWGDLYCGGQIEKSLRAMLKT